LEQAIAKGPELADDHLRRGHLLFQGGNFPEALEAYSRAALLQPGLAKAHQGRAAALERLHRHPEAEAALSLGLATGKLTGKDAAAVYRARAEVRALLRNFAGAAADFTLALEADPTPANHLARGWAYLRGEAPRLALQDFAEAVRLAPRSGFG